MIMSLIFYVTAHVTPLRFSCPRTDAKAQRVPKLSGISTLELLASTAGNHHINLLDALELFVKVT
jgi:hypothetical protein